MCPHHDAVAGAFGCVCEHVLDEDVDERAEIGSRQGDGVVAGLHARCGGTVLFLSENPPESGAVAYDLTKIDRFDR